MKAHQEAAASISASPFCPDRAAKAARIFTGWLNSAAQADRIDLLLFLSSGENALARAVQATSLPGFPRHGLLQASRTTLVLAETDYRNFEERLDLQIEGFSGLTLCDLLRGLNVPPPAEHVLDDLGFGGSPALTAKQGYSLRRFLMAYRWEILKSAARARRGVFLQLQQFRPEPGMRLAVVDSGLEADIPDALEAAIAGMFDLDLYVYRLHAPRLQRDNDGIQVRALLGPEAKDLVSAQRAFIQRLFAPGGGRVVGYEELGHRMEPVLLGSDTPSADMDAFMASVEAHCRLSEPAMGDRPPPEPAQAFLDLLKDA